MKKITPLPYFIYFLDKFFELFPKKEIYLKISYFIMSVLIISYTFFTKNFILGVIFGFIGFIFCQAAFKPKRNISLYDELMKIKDNYEDRVPLIDVLSEQDNLLNNFKIALVDSIRRQSFNNLYFVEEIPELDIRKEKLEELYSNQHMNLVDAIQFCEKYNL